MVSFCLLLGSFFFFCLRRVTFANRGRLWGIPRLRARGTDSHASVSTGSE